MSGGGGGLFHRREKDKRFVKHVTTLAHQPSHWLPMDVQEVECKLMEVRKYSAEYYEVDEKFRKPNLELITVYAVQNPFLMGSFLLRREQLAMQLANAKISVKEKVLFYPTTFKQLEFISRNNFLFSAELDGKKVLEFYETSKLAHEALKKDTNPRIVIMARVVTGINHDVTSAEVEVTEGRRTHLPSFTPDRMAIDTWIGKDVIYKRHINEVYPDKVLIYRDKSGPADKRTSRIADVIENCQISYRAGTRFNPDEAHFKGAAQPQLSASASFAEKVPGGKNGGKNLKNTAKRAADVKMSVESETDVSRKKDGEGNGSSPKGKFKVSGSGEAAETMEPLLQKEDGKVFVEVAPAASAAASAASAASASDATRSAEE